MSVKRLKVKSLECETTGHMPHFRPVEIIAPPPITYYIQDSNNTNKL